MGVVDLNFGPHRHGLPNVVDNIRCLQRTGMHRISAHQEEQSGHESSRRLTAACKPLPAGSFHSEQAQSLFSSLSTTSGCESHLNPPRAALDLAVRRRCGFRRMSEQTRGGEVLGGWEQLGGLCAGRKLVERAELARAVRVSAEAEALPDFFCISDLTLLKGSCLAHGAAARRETPAGTLDGTSARKTACTGDRMPSPRGTAWMILCGLIGVRHCGSCQWALGGRRRRL
eukprot:SAG31_NODE_1349_length_8691_cov_6.407239_6_plen_229_part_00